MIELPAVYRVRLYFEYRNQGRKVIRQQSRVSANGPPGCSIHPSGFLRIQDP